MFPAPAGINRRFFYRCGSVVSVPRASGDKPRGVPQSARAEKCSPRQRG
ncbi:hypothetical protein A628_00730 [Salmonella enterica subsp. enterica serovar Cubana str. 76814]|uniref:Uncharacterized protein n=1 Tax=Salmonella enterica subsp. enterica serovar Cubana str. 76814 TaxID=1192560 RepID=V7IWQ5_SALET|nr:hypothetical protein A628_00730 [Salmonella enterica subsp. enterica serovar Cubana str. 76814]